MRIKFIFLSRLLVILLFFQFSTNIFADSKHERSINEIISNIRSELGLKEKDKIDPNKVSDVLLEELGDALMGVMHSDSRQHEWMDNMMGGEGSESLAAMHKSMGYNYLSSNYSGNIMTGRWWPRHGFNKWSNRHPVMADGYGGMMGNWRGFNFGYGLGGILMGVFFLILLGLAIFFVFFAISKSKIFKGTAEDTPLEILKKRYAKGEITKEEFENMKKDL